MPDIESPPSSPPREVRFSRSTKTHSPALQTVLSSDTTAGLTINHSFSGTSNASSRRSTGTGALFGMSKPAAALIGLVLLGTMGAGVWGWLQIPGLDKQIQELEEQVNRLEGQVDRLEIENERYAELNHEFNTTLSELQLVNAELESQVWSLKQEVGRLGGLVDQLGDLNDQYSEINDDLNNTILELQYANADLKTTAENLSESVGSLNSTVTVLEQHNQALQEENKRYSDLNTELRTIASYLNETANDLDEGYGQLVTQLAQQITGNRVLVLQSLRSLYMQRISYWDCSFRDVFRGETFVLNEDILIGGALPEVLEYIEDRVLSELCLNATDFELYLDSRYGLNLVSANQLYQSVATYSSRAMSFYFPDEGEVGLTPEDWARAGYECSGVAKFAMIYD